ncbi:MAG: hypothetical protein ABEI07_00135, partial [Candidatus Nanohaloarchaea archaeon]
MRKGISTSTLMPVFAVVVAVSIAAIAVTGNQGVIPSAGNWLENALNSSPDQCRGNCNDRGGNDGNGQEPPAGPKGSVTLYKSQDLSGDRIIVEGESPE